MRTQCRADAVNCIVIFLKICIKSCVNSFFQSFKTMCYGDNVCAKHLHTDNVRVLFFNINLAHIDVTFHTKICRSSSYGNTMLTCACFRNQLLFAHIFCKQALAHTVVKLMCACVVKVLSFKINLAVAEQFGKSFTMVNRCRSALKFLSYSA